MIPVQGVKGKRVAVLGLGRTGLSAARALVAGGAEVLCWDDGAAGRAAADVEDLPIEDLSKTDWSEISLLVVSPGIPHLYPKPHPIIAAGMSAGVPVDNDIGLFFRSLATPEWDRMERPPRVVAVTGSNGKSTTSALIHHTLAEAGRPSQLAGNIGRGVLDLDPLGDGGIVVLELSSYQTELARALTPDIAVFTNLSPDHLDRHGGMGGYFAAKRRLFAEGGPDRAIIGVDEPEGLFLTNQLTEAAMMTGSSGYRMQSCPVRVGTYLPAKGFLQNGARAGRSPISTCARSPAFPGRITIRTLVLRMPCVARWASRHARSKLPSQVSKVCRIAARLWARKTGCGL